MRTLNNNDWYLCLLHMILKSVHFSDKNNWLPLSYSYSMLPLIFTSNLYRTRFYCNFSDVTQSQSNIQNFVIFHIHFLQIRYQIKADIQIHRTKYTELFIRFWSRAFFSWWDEIFLSEFTWLIFYFGCSINVSMLHFKWKCTDFISTCLHKLPVK